MNIVSSKQKAALKSLAVGSGFEARSALAILNCVDHGVVPAPEAVEWFVEWLRTSKGTAA